MSTYRALKSVLLPSILLPLLIILGSCRDQSHPITIKTLLKQMVDRSHLAQYPDPYYETGQFSSYDRRSKRPGEPEWFANMDRSYFLRTEQHRGRTEYVMMDTTGPGAITRFWMTFGGPGAGQGTLRVYLDHGDQPVIEGNALDIISGGKLTGEPLSASVSSKTDYDRRGHNLYLPIPYHKHIKVTYESKHIGKPGAPSGGEAVYYNINFRSYEPDTPVRTFTKRRLENAEKLLHSVQQRIGDVKHTAALPKKSLKSRQTDTTLKAGGTYSVSIDDAGAIRHLGMSVSAENRHQALRSTVLELQFDGRSTVWTPVGDFFGTGYQIRPHTTWYTDITEEGMMHTYWVMPFKKSAAVNIHNLGNQPVTVQGLTEWSDWNWNNRSMHFGSTWRGAHDVDTGERKSPEGEGGPFDINFTHLEGEGVYVGDALNLFNTAYAWWGEGDEKIYIDGEQFPSHFGTGTEDYYGYAWTRSALFTDHPFISQPDGSGNNTPGYTVNLRYRSLDAIPFQRELKVDMELWHWVSATIDYAVTTYFYSRPDARMRVHRDTAAVQEAVSLQRSDIISDTITNGRIEGENMRLDTLSNGAIKYQNLNEPNWSQNKQLWWHGAEPNDFLKLLFYSNNQAIYEINGRFTKAHDYGSFEIQINGQSAGNYNVYSDSLTTTDINLGKHKIHKGLNTLKVTIKEVSPKEQKAFWGLDYLQFDPVN